MDVASHYRKLLKHMRALPSFKSNSLLSRSIKERILNSSGLKDDAEAQQHALKNLHAYITMITSVNELNYLRGLDSGEKVGPREKINLTARRVGFSIPKFADELDFSERDDAGTGKAIEKR